MSFDVIDWELEARRIVAAFEATSRCAFDEPDERDLPRNLLTLGGDWPSIWDGMALCVRYYANHRSYQIGHVSDYGYSTISIFRDGRIYVNVQNDTHRAKYVKALYCLGQLDIEGGTTLGAVISGTERIEWETAFNDRLEQMEK